MTKKKKSSRQKRTLIGAVCIAAVIMAGSTFAWFTSKDEVTNRLSASASYNVTIAETFTPPEEWVPGQEVNKDVFAVNTGNIDALVKQTISSKITVTNEAEGDDLTKALPAKAVKLGTQYSKTQDALSDSYTYSADEVTAIMAGSLLAYTNNTTDVTKVGRLTVNVDGTTKTTTTPALTQAPTSGTAITPGVSTEGASFTPAGTGLYIFRRTISKTDSTSADTTETYTYSGFYFNGTDYYKVSLNDKALNALVDQGNNGVLTKALTKTTTTNDTTGETTEVFAVKDTEQDTVKGAAKYIVEDTVVATPVLTYEAESTTVGSEHPARLVATYGGKNTAAADDDIVIYINLKNIDNTGATADKWQMLPATLAADATGAAFYYTNDLEAGNTSAQLVDSIVMSKDTKNEAYKHFDFDLNVALDSVQIVKASDGTELVPGASAPNTATAVNDLGATATATNTSAEITLVTWSATT